MNENRRQRRELVSRYGPDDLVGSANEVTCDKVLEATRLVVKGRRYNLAQLLDDSAPMPMWRYWKQALLTDRAVVGRFVGSNVQSYLEETVCGATHSGTHLDGLAHIGIGEYTYNGIPYSSIVSATGVSSLGIEHVPPLVTRGVLLDIAGLKDRACLADGYRVTGEDLDEACARQEVVVGPGDGLLVHTGWSQFWDRDPARYLDGEPGLGLDAAEWATSRRVAFIGADNWAVEVVPAEGREEAFPVHQWCLVRYGCYLLENLRTEDLVRDSVWECLVVVAPLRTRGTTASMVSPIAVA